MARERRRREYDPMTRQRRRETRVVDVRDPEKERLEAEVKDLRLELADAKRRLEAPQPEDPAVGQLREARDRLRGELEETKAELAGIRAERLTGGQRAQVLAAAPDPAALARAEARAERAERALVEEATAHSQTKAEAAGRPLGGGGGSPGWATDRPGSDTNTAGYPPGAVIPHTIEGPNAIDLESRASRDRAAFQQRVAEARRSIVQLLDELTTGL